MNGLEHGKGELKVPPYEFRSGVWVNGKREYWNYTPSKKSPTKEDNE